MSGIGTTKEIKLERWTTVKDGNGNNIESMTFSVTRWATVKRVGANRNTTAGQTSIRDSVLFHVRFSYNFDPSGNWRVVYDNLRHTVDSIVKDEEKRFYWFIQADSKGIR